MIIRWTHMAIADLWKPSVAAVDILIIIKYTKGAHTCDRNVFNSQSHFDSSRPCRLNMTIFWRLTIIYSDCIYFHWNLRPLVIIRTRDTRFTRSIPTYSTRYIIIIIIIIITCLCDFMNFPSDPLNLNVGFWNESVRLECVTC